MIDHLIAHNGFLFTNNTIGHSLTQILRASTVGSIQRRIKEVAHVVNDGSCLAKFSESTCALASH